MGGEEEVRRGSPRRNAGYRYRERIDRRADGLRLIDWLSRRYRHSSEGTWRVRIAAGEIQLDRALPAADTPLRMGQELIWERPPWLEAAVPDDWRIVHRDDAILVVSKPAGLPTLPGGGFLENTLQAMVQASFPEAAALHRLGRGTSGLLVFALEAEAGRRLSAAFRRREVRRRYLALVEGIPDWDELDIRTRIGEVEHPILGSVHAASPSGKKSRSTARVLERRGKEALLEVEIETGRPHQIRIHLASVGFPLRGDPLYRVGGRPRPGALPGDLGYHLHAWKLAFSHPGTGRWLEFEDPPPLPLRFSTG